MKKIVIKNKTILLLLVVTIFIGACSEDFLNPEQTQLATSEQINELALQGGETVVDLASSIISGAYNAMIDYQGRHDAFGEMSLGLAGDLMTEDMVQDYNHYFYFDYQIDNNAAAYARPSNTWNYLFSVVSKCNEVIAMIPAESEDVDLKYILGEALALRSYAYLRLTQRFQQTYVGNEDKPSVPLTLTVNDEEESVPTRATQKQIYDKVLADLEAAIALLDGYNRPNKTRINKNVAAGILARASMDVEDWEKAATYANMARSGYSLMTQTEVKTDGFNNIENKEWLWGADITGETTTMFASFFSHVCSYDVGYGESTFAPKLIDARLYSQIGANDARKVQFKDPTSPIDGKSEVTEENAPTYCNFKFKKVAGWLADYVYMRASEMYLIEAEALARQSSKQSEAYTVLKEFMNSRDSDWASNNSTATPEEVFLQKRIELWGEGHIFYDYLRLKQDINRDYDGTNHAEKKNITPGSWKLIYQIPQAEIDNNNDLTEDDQNPLE